MKTSESDDRRTSRDLSENWAGWRAALMWDPRFRTVWSHDGRMMATWFSVQRG